MPFRHALAIGLATLLAGCASGPGMDAGAVGAEAAFEGELLAVDTAPWAYDGNARLRVRTADRAEWAVELPARWNLCKASGIGDAGGFTAGQRVEVRGTVTAPRTVTVCSGADHRIARLR